MKAFTGIAFVFIAAMAVGVVIPAVPIAYAFALAVLGIVISR